MAGQCGWSPSEFWKSTFTELHFMHKGFLYSQGIDPDKDNFIPADSSDLKWLQEKRIGRRTIKTTDSD